MRLSIIIPTYNVENYIAKCLDSCLNQDIDKNEYEIIVVNDGSKDKSISIAEQYVSRYDNIRIINRNNGGLSAARNTGLSEAKGDYVWFLDSDDTIEPNCLGKLLNKAQSFKLDVLCFTLKLVYPNGQKMKYEIPIKQCFNPLEHKVYRGTDFIFLVDMPGSACIALYRRLFLINADLKFVEGILHEDQEFTPRAYCLAKRILFMDMAFYDYYQREGSIMKSSRNSQRCKDLLTIADSLYGFVQTHLDPDSDSYKAMMARVYFCVTQSLAFFSPDTIPLATYQNKPYYPMDTAIVGGSMKKKLRLANLSLRLYNLLYKLFK